MSIKYVPINGYAGKIKLRLYNLNEDSVSNDVELLVFSFSESDSESPMNNEFNNILGDYIQDHYGWHKTISFDLINGKMSDSGVLTVNNHIGILTVTEWINLIRQYPKTYRLEIDYRLGEIVSTIFNAQYIGDIELNEISQSSNTGQIVNLTFRETTFHQLRFDSTEMIKVLVDNNHTDETQKILIDNDSNVTSEHYIILID